jgi:hypothetical protein
VTRDRATAPPGWRPWPARGRVVVVAGVAILLLAGASVATAFLARASSRTTRAEQPAAVPIQRGVPTADIVVPVASPVVAPVAIPVAQSEPPTAAMDATQGRNGRPRAAAAKKTSSKGASAATKPRLTDEW